MSPDCLAVYAISTFYYLTANMWLTVQYVLISLETLVLLGCWFENTQCYILTQPFFTEPKQSVWSLTRAEVQNALCCTSCVPSNWKHPKLLGFKIAGSWLSSSSDLFFLTRSLLKGAPVWNESTYTVIDIKAVKDNGKTRACPLGPLTLWVIIQEETIAPRGIR